MKITNIPPSLVLRGGAGGGVLAQTKAVQHVAH